MFSAQKYTDLGVVEATTTYIVTLQISFLLLLDQVDGYVVWALCLNTG